jgi:RNA-directed DNA polymerase
MKGAKSFKISKQLVMKAYERVKANKGAAGIDNVSIAEFEKELKGNLYKIWNRICSGCYLPPPVKLVEIPKSNGGKRPLGIPTVADRVAQMVVVMAIEPQIEPHFHDDSYAYRKNRSALQAIAVAKQRCRKYPWVVDLDISQFFDSIDHAMLLKALQKHTDCKWALLYIRRWLVVPYEHKDGTQVPRDKGVPQGSVIGPILANLFLHYAFDEWMKRNYPHNPFERYADDCICHCTNRIQAEEVREAIRVRLQACKLELNEEKTHIVYCKDSNRKQVYENIQFDFLGYTFRPRVVKSQIGVVFTGFNPAISNRAKKRICDTIREWHPGHWTLASLTLEEIAREINPVIQGWINYYGAFYPSELKEHLRHVDQRLVSWVRMKFKRFKRRQRASTHFLGGIAAKQPELFAHWKWGYRPAASPT